MINCLRPVTLQIWQSLPETEKRRFLRHVRTYWEVHRHRAAPEIAQFLEDQRTNWKIQLHAGRIINCTSPETDCRCLRDPLLTALLAHGLVRPDPLFLGLDTSADGALINRDGIVSDSLYTLGPARKGSLWESTAVPEIREQVYRLVRHLVNESEQMHQIGLDPIREESHHVTGV